MPLNPCELELDLFCRGLRVPPPRVARGCTRDPPDARGPRVRTRVDHPHRVVAQARNLDERAGRPDGTVRCAAIDFAAAMRL